MSSILIFFLMVVNSFSAGCRARSAVPTMSKKTKCLNPPRTAKKVEHNIMECKEEVKNKIIKEAFDILKDQFQADQYENEHHHLHHDGIEEHFSFDEGTGHHPGLGIEKEYLDQHYIMDEEQHNNFSKAGGIIEEILSKYQMKKKRSLTYNPTSVPSEEKRIAGCLLYCVYSKNNALDKHGWPALDGLVDFYTEGVNEHGFFMATLKAVNLCLNIASRKYHINRHNLPEGGESCDIAFDVFDCISDQITVYCLDEYHHE